MSDEFDIEVELLFELAPDRHASVRTNPVTGSRWMPEVDPIEPQKRAAQQALDADAWFRAQAPAGAPALPLSYPERETLKQGGGLNYIVAWFARSLATRGYRCHGHPGFSEYARGVMASRYSPPFILNDQELIKQFPPKPLEALGPGLICGQAEVSP